VGEDNGILPAMSRTTAIIENGHNVYASTGAVGQHGGKLKIMECNECHRQVVWVESKRTGRFYLCNVRESNGDLRWRYYRGDDVHDCEKEKAYSAKIAESIAAQDKEEQRKAALRVINDAMDEAWDAGDKELFSALRRQAKMLREAAL
jgi:hypothetical protein